MTTPFRELLDKAMGDIDVYKHPNLTEFQERLNEILEAADQPTTGRDRIESIWQNDDTKCYEIGTAYSRRGCAMNDEIELPFYVAHADDPMAAALEWKREFAINAARETVEEAQEDLDRAKRRLEAAKEELAKAKEMK